MIIIIIFIITIIIINISTILSLNSAYICLCQGVDLTKTTSAALASQAALDELGTTNDLTSLVTALPSQGVLKPGEKRFIHFCFSPRFTRSNKGWKLIDQPPPRRDFALFMHIETVGSVGSVVGNKNGENNGKS